MLISDMQKLWNDWWEHRNGAQLKGKTDFIQVQQYNALYKQK